MINYPKNWKDYELIDAGDGEKLERWGKYILRRPEPQALWPKNPGSLPLWDKPHMFYHRASKGGGHWDNLSKVPESWIIEWEELNFIVKPTSFKHTALFPEQATNWDFLITKLQEFRKTNPRLTPKALNLFAYTGGATVACSYAGAEVTHIDASKGMIALAKENLEISSLGKKVNRFIQDDVIKFVKREINRGNQYDVIIMDPPAYGRGASGEMWQIEDSLTELIELTAQLLSNTAVCMIVNFYATNLSPIAVENALKTIIRRNGKTSSGELGLKLSSRDLVLPCSYYARWENA